MWLVNLMAFLCHHYALRTNQFTRSVFSCSNRYYVITRSWTWPFKGVECVCKHSTINYLTDIKNLDSLQVKCFLLCFWSPPCLKEICNLVTMQSPYIRLSLHSSESALVTVTCWLLRLSPESTYWTPCSSKLAEEAKFSFQVACFQ